MNPDNPSTERSPEDRRSLTAALSFHHELYDIADTVLKTRAIRALENVAARYPICRSVRCATRRKVQDVFDDLALHMSMTALRLDEGTLLLDGPGVFVQAEGRRKADYCSCAFGIWAESKARADEVRDALFRLVGARYSPNQMFTIDWHFMNSRSGLSSASFDEVCVEPIFDEAYPTLEEPVHAFIAHYLDASETVLILQGPPGTGKTRLVRGILGEISKRRNRSANVMYTGDKRALENDEIFVDFITGSHDAFVIEDADHMLLARSSGNHDLHRFLAIADGVVRAQGRKIIFTTNLPNVSDIDEALLRPGRCFARVRTRALTQVETAALLARLAQDEAHRQDVLAKVTPTASSSASLATVYRVALQV